MPIPDFPTDVADNTDSTGGTPRGGAAGFLAGWMNNVGSWLEEFPIKEVDMATAVGANLAATYANGTAGVGATLTANPAAAMPTVDGVAPAVGQRILVKDQTSAAQNGVYTVTTITSPWVLTRASDADTPAKLSDSDVRVSGGSTQGDTEWKCGVSTLTRGTTTLPFRRSFPFYTPGGPRDPWGAGASTTTVVAQNMARADAAGTYSLPLSTQQLLIGGIVAPAGRTVTNVNWICTQVGAAPTIDWFALCLVNATGGVAVRTTVRHTTNITSAPGATGIVTRALTSTWTPDYDSVVWVVWSHSNATTAKIALASPTGSAVGNLVAPAMSATNGTTPTTTVPTDGTTVITAPTTGVANIPLIWLT
jgi:hypothetical protein